MTRAVRLASLLAGALALAPGAFPAPARGQATADDAAARLARLTRAYAPVRTLTADFTQETRFPGFPDPRTYGGRLELMRPDRMRWDYTDGSAQQVYIDGRTVTLYAPEAGQAIESVLTPASDAQVPLHLLSDVTKVADTYDVAAGPDPDALVLTPRAPDPKAPERVTLWLDPATDLIARVLLELPGGSRSDLTFTHVAVNAPVDAARFAFVLPKGAVLIRAADLLPRRGAASRP